MVTSTATPQDLKHLVVAVATAEAAMVVMTAAQDQIAAKNAAHVVAAMTIATKRHCKYE